MATFRHKTIRRFRIGGFEFKNFLLVIKDEKEADKFRKLMQDAPRRDSNSIVELDEQALANLERPVGGPRVLRGSSDTGKVKQASSEGPSEPGFVSTDAPGQERSPGEDPGTDIGSESKIREQAQEQTDASIQQRKAIDDSVTTADLNGAEKTNDGEADKADESKKGNSLNAFLNAKK